jgi:pimeloyl-ACP methyl ester carboxylesterase
MDGGSLRVTTSRGVFAALRWSAKNRADIVNPLVILLHGFPDHPPNFAPLAEAIAAQGYDVLAPFLRGYSPSPCDGDFSTEGLSKDVVAIIAASTDNRVILVGHDWGAVLTYAVCATAGEKIACATAMSVPHPLAFVRSLAGRQGLRSWYMAAFQLPGSARVARIQNFASIRWLWRRWSPRFVLSMPATESLTETLGASWPAPLQYYRRAARPLTAAVARTRGPIASPINVPTLYLHGTDDGCIKFVDGKCKQYFRSSYQERLIEGAGHFLPHEMPVRCAADIVHWHQHTTQLDERRSPTESQRVNSNYD